MPRSHTTVAVQSQTAAGHGGSLLECQHWKSEAGGSPGVLGQPYLPSEFQAIQVYRAGPVSKTKQNKTQNKMQLPRGRWAWPDEVTHFLPRAPVRGCSPPHPHCSPVYQNQHQIVSPWVIWERGPLSSSPTKAQSSSTGSLVTQRALTASHPPVKWHLKKKST